MIWPFKRGKVEQKSSTTYRQIKLDDLSGSFLACSLLGETITPQKAFQFYRQNSSVATAVDLIADAFEQIQPILQLKDGSIIDSSPVLDLLKNPNVYQTWSDFAARISRHYLLTNEAHFFGLGVVGMSPIEIYPVKPTMISTGNTLSEYVSVFYVSTGIAQGTYNEAGTKQRIARYYSGPMKELYRITGFSSAQTEARADSPLQAAALETQQQIKGRIHNMKVLDNGGRLSMLIVFKEEHLGDDEHAARTQRINETFGGANNAGKIGVMSGGDVQEVREMGQNNKDMDYLQLDKVASQSIYLRYKIPLPLVSTDATTFNNMQTAIELMYDFAVLPLADKMFSGISRFLLPRFGIDINAARITYNPDSLQALKARRLKELMDRKNIGIETINELREGMPNREPIEGGDVLYQNATLVPLGTDMTEPEPRTMPDNDTDNET